MSSIIITLKTIKGGPVDLELPGNVPVSKLLPALIEALKQRQPPINLSPDEQYRLVRGSKILEDDETLFDAGLLMGKTLTLQPADVPLRATESNVGYKYPKSASLVTSSGRVIALNNYGKNELVIGRYDPATKRMPDIDLSGEQDGDTVSRQHAKLQLHEDQWDIVPISPRNPTRIGRQIVHPGHAHSLKSGDEVIVGLVRLVYKND